jgi:hypothetical protein
MDVLKENEFSCEREASTGKELTSQTLVSWRNGLCCRLISFQMIMLRHSKIVPSFQRNVDCWWARVCSFLIWASSLASNSNIWVSGTNDLTVNAQEHYQRKQHTHNPKIINDHKKHSKIPNFSSKKERNCSWSSCVVLLGSCVDFLWKVHAYQPYYGHAIPFKQNSFKNSGIACLAGKSLWTFLFMSTEIPWYAGPVKE